MKIITVNVREVKKTFRNNYLKVFCYVVGLFPIAHWLDRKEDERMALFRDKSALYKRDPPPEEPSW